MSDLVDTADPLAAANEEADKVRARSVELIHQTQARVEEMRAEIEEEVAAKAAEAESQAEEILEAARAQAAVIVAEGEERKAEIVAETEARVELIEQEAIKAGVEAVDADRAKYKERITEIVNQSLTDARALIANGEDQAKEMVEQAEEQAAQMRAEVEELKAEAEEIKAEAEAMRAKAEDALQVAEEEAEEKRQHAAGMLEAIERLKTQLQARAAEQGITAESAQPAESSPASSGEPEPVAIQHKMPIVRPSSS